VSRPSETLQAAIGSIVGAALIVAGAFLDTSKITPEVVGALTILLSWVAALVTWYVARKQRTGELAAAKDGSVSS
jgi:phosphate/sulfate permease